MVDVRFLQGLWIFNVPDISLASYVLVFSIKLA